MAGWSGKRGECVFWPSEKMTLPSHHTSSQLLSYNFYSFTFPTKRRRLFTNAFIQFYS